MQHLLKTALRLLLCALLSLPVFADVVEEMEKLTCGDYTYVLLEDGGARITGYDGDDAELTVPDELDGYPVQEIGEDAFSFCNSLTSVILPDSLSSIGDDAFSRCSFLTSITLPDSLTSIGGNPFSGCSSLAEIDVSPDNPVFVQIDGVLYEKATKTLICYPAGKAGDSFAVPDGILVIGDDAFFSCEALTSVTLPDSLTSIGGNPFSGCSSLAKIDVSPDNPVFAQTDGVLYEKATKTLICYPAGKAGDSFAVPDGILVIGDDAFSFCNALTSITLPDGLASIGDFAFSGCYSLTSVTLPDGLTSIGDLAFFYCSSLTSVTLPDSLTSIGYFAFMGLPGRPHPHRIAGFLRPSVCHRQRPLLHSPRRQRLALRRQCRRPVPSGRRHCRLLIFGAFCCKMK